MQQISDNKLSEVVTIFPWNILKEVFVYVIIETRAM